MKFALNILVYLILLIRLEASPLSFLERHIQTLFSEIDFSSGTAPSYHVFREGIIGYYNLHEKGKLTQSKILTLVDFSLSSTRKRMWIVHLEEKRLLMHTYVAHGKNTGVEYARDFSNTPYSNQSSLGFYVTDKIYYGKHGLSLRLKGMEPAFNDKAEDRAIVLHGASYVSESFIKEHGRLGRSQGCPAVPDEMSSTVIDIIANKTCLYIYHPNQHYHQKSRLLNAQNAAMYLMHISHLFTPDEIAPSRL